MIYIRTPFGRIELIEQDDERIRIKVWEKIGFCENYREIGELEFYCDDDHIYLPTCSTHKEVTKFLSTYYQKLGFSVRRMEEVVLL